MKIRVKEMAFYAGARRRPGDELDNVPDDLKGGWFDVLSKASAPKAPDGDKLPAKGVLAKRLKELGVPFDGKQSAEELAALLPDGDPLKSAPSPTGDDLV